MLSTIMQGVKTMKENKEYSQAIAQAKKNLADLNERGADAISGDVLEFMNSILTFEEITITPKKKLQTFTDK